MEIYALTLLMGVNRSHVILLLRTAAFQNFPSLPSVADFNWSIVVSSFIALGCTHFLFEPLLCSPLSGYIKFNGHSTFLLRALRRAFSSSRLLQPRCSGSEHEPFSSSCVSEQNVQRRQNLEEACGHHANTCQQSCTMVEARSDETDAPSCWLWGLYASTHFLLPSVRAWPT